MKRWLRRVVLISFAIAYAIFAWNNAAVLVVRNAATPGGRGVLDLQKHLGSERSDIRIAAAQRLADYSGSTAALSPLITAIWRDEKDRQEIGWYMAQAVSRMDDSGGESIAILALENYDAAVERFEQLPPPAQADALLGLLKQQDLASDRDSLLAGEIALRLGRFGENADFQAEAIVNLALSRRQTIADSDRYDSLRATQVAAALLEHYREYELPPAVELALVQLGKPAVLPICHVLKEKLETDVHFSRRIGFYRTLTRLGPLATEAETTLLQAIAWEPVNQSFYAAMEALLAIEPRDRTAAGQAIRAAMTPERWEPAGYDWPVIEADCMLTLQCLGDDPTIDQMIEELNGQRISSLGVRIDAINSPESWRTIRLLGKAGTRAQRALEILARGLESHSPEVRIESALAVYRVGEDRDAALLTLESFLDPRRNTPDNIGLALVALAEVGWPADRPNEPLLQLLSSGPTVEVRQLAANSLHRSRAADVELTDVFVRRLLAEPDAQVRQFILNLLADRLAEMEGTSLRKIEIPQAIQWLQNEWTAPAKDATGETELQARLAEQKLKQAGPEGAIAVARWIVESAECPPTAIEFFNSMGDRRQAAVPVLTEAVLASDAGISRRAVVVLGQMGKLAETAFDSVATTEFPETEEVLRRIDPQAFLARTSRRAEWYFLLAAPFLLVIALLAEWGWTNSDKSAIMQVGSEPQEPRSR